MAVSAPSPETTAALLRDRRTIHLFTDETPPDSLVRDAIEVARWAPNHRLTEPWRFYLLGDTTTTAIVELNTQLVRARRGARAAKAKQARWRSIPGWLLVTSTRSPDDVRDQENYAATACAVQNLQLYLWTHGVGVKWTTGRVTRDPTFWDLVQVDPEVERLVGLLWYGYPAAVPTTKRAPVECILTTRP
ncbi:MAG: nitroreductase [Bacteroidetes bacterium]|jgi:nitroreductase|nr:nitroreductase [Bacteroidota bacterium]